MSEDPFGYLHQKRPILITCKQGMQKDEEFVKRYMTKIGNKMHSKIHVKSTLPDECENETLFNVLNI